MDLSSDLVRAIFCDMMKENNCVIVETITCTNFCYILNLLSHLGFNTEDLRTYNTNFVIYKDSKDTMMTVRSDAVRNIFEGFMKCLKLPNKKMCDICNIKKKCFRECAKCKNKLCVECFKNHNKNCVNSCPYCRYNMIEHSKTNNKLLEDMLMGGDLT